MTNPDTEVIRRAVELVGWPMNGTYLFMSPWGFETGSTAIDNVPQHELDALAAALVREVDALDEYFIDHVNDGKNHYAWTEVAPLNGAWCVARAEGPNRTKNTLRAIVESGVLG